MAEKVEEYGCYADSDSVFVICVELLPVRVTEIAVENANGLIAKFRNHQIGKFTDYSQFIVFV